MGKKHKRPAAPFGDVDERTTPKVEIVEESPASPEPLQNMAIDLPIDLESASIDQLTTYLDSLRGQLMDLGEDESPRASPKIIPLDPPTDIPLSRQPSEEGEVYDNPKSPDVIVLSDDEEEEDDEEIGQLRQLALLSRKTKEIEASMKASVASGSKEDPRKEEEEDVDEMRARLLKAMLMKTKERSESPVVPSPTTSTEMIDNASTSVTSETSKSSKTKIDKFVINLDDDDDEEEKKAQMDMKIHSLLSSARQASSKPIREGSVLSKMSDASQKEYLWLKDQIKMREIKAAGAIGQLKHNQERMMELKVSIDLMKSDIPLLVKKRDAKKNQLQTAQQHANKMSEMLQAAQVVVRQTTLEYEKIEEQLNTINTDLITDQKAFVEIERECQSIRQKLDGSSAKSTKRTALDAGITTSTTSPSKKPRTVTPSLLPTVTVKNVVKPSLENPKPSSVKPKPSPEKPKSTLKSRYKLTITRSASASPVKTVRSVSLSKATPSPKPKTKVALATRSINLKLTTPARGHATRSKSAISSKTATSSRTVSSTKNISSSKKKLVNKKRKIPPSEQRQQMVNFYESLRNLMTETNPEIDLDPVIQHTPASSYPSVASEEDIKISPSTSDDMKTYSSVLNHLHSYRFSKNFNKSTQKNSFTDNTACNGVDPNNIICPFDLVDKCTDSKCPMQHKSKYMSPTKTSKLIDLVLYCPSIAGVSNKCIKNKWKDAEFRIREFIKTLLERRKNDSKDVDYDAVAGDIIALIKQRLPDHDITELKRNTVGRYKSRAVIHFGKFQYGFSLDSRGFPVIDCQRIVLDDDPKENQEPEADKPSKTRFYMQPTKQESETPQIASMTSEQIVKDALKGLVGITSTSHSRKTALLMKESLRLMARGLEMYPKDPLLWREYLALYQTYCITSNL